MLKKSKMIAKEFSNVKIIKGDLENLSKLFPPKYFDFSLCVWILWEMWKMKLKY